MKLLMNTGGVAMTNCFVIADEKAGTAVLFDAPDHTVGPLLDEVAKAGWTLAGVWLTHGHFDHFADHAVAKKRFPAAQILLHPLDEPKVRKPDLQTRAFGLPFTIPPLQPDKLIKNDEVLHIGSMEARVLHTPGHSQGHVAYYLPAEKILIGGDLIIGGSVGRTDLPDSDHAQLEASIRKVMRLPAETRLLGGHGDITTLGDELATNYYVQAAVRGG